MKRLTVIPPTPPKPHRSRSTPSGTAAERRDDQRRRSIGRRVTEERRQIAAREDPLFADQRRPADRRGRAPRRKLEDRRSGVRMFDLTKLDLSDLDS